jgi:hypothetical protein
MQRLSATLATILATAMVSTLCLAATAAGQTTIGQVSPAEPSADCVNGPVQFFQTQVVSGPSYTAQRPGLLTSWSTNAAKGKGQELELRVLRPTGPGAYVVVAHDGPRPLVAKTLNTFPIGIPVQAGDLIGLTDAKGPIETACVFSGAVGDRIGHFFGDTPDQGAFKEEGMGDFERRVNVSATELSAPAIGRLGGVEGSIRGGTRVTIQGSEFTGVSGVSFGAVAAQSFTVDSESQITAVAPAVSRPGEVAVTVTNRIGTGTAPMRFAYKACVVPRVVGLKLARARVRLHKAGCRSGRVRRHAAAPRRAGKVLKEGPRPGRILAPGSKVNLAVGE